MSEKKSGKRLPASYWLEQIKAMRKGELEPKELVQQSDDYLKSQGYIYNPVLGWVKQEELEEAKLDENQNAVPIRIDTTKEGKKKRINYRFSQYMDKKKKEDWRRNTERADVESMVDSLADSMEAPF